MMNFLNHKISNEFIIIATFLITASGTLIINFYLNKQYHITDYSIISARVIHTGIMFFLICSLSITVIFSFIDIYDIGIKWSTITNFISKPIHLTNCFIMIFFLTAITPQDSYTYSLFGYQTFKSYWIYPMLMCSVFGWLFKLSAYQLIKSSTNTSLFFSKAAKIILTLANIMLFIGIFALPIMCYNSAEYINCFFFFGTLSLWSFTAFCAIADSQNRKKQNNPDINLSMFTKNTIAYSPNLVENFFYFAILIFSLITLINTYSNSLYPLLDFYLGGGKPVNTIITLDDNTIITGKIFNYDDKRYYVISSDNKKIMFIDNSKIKTLENNQ